MDSIRDVLQLPADDRNIRLTEFDPELFRMKKPYTIIVEINMFSGRSVETKKELYHNLMRTLSENLNIQKRKYLF